MILWAMPEDGVEGCPGRGGGEERCWNEALEPFLEI